MNKSELVAAMAEKTELSKKDAEAALKAFTDVVAEELKKGEKIQDSVHSKCPSAQSVQAEIRRQVKIW